MRKRHWKADQSLERRVLGQEARGESERKPSDGKGRGYRPGRQGHKEVRKQRTVRYLISERLQLFSQVAGGITGRKLAFTWMLIPLFLPVWQDECLLSR